MGVIANGISAYQTARINKDNDPKLAEIAKDIRTASLPIGPVGQLVELYQVTSAVIFNYTPYPNAAKAYLQFMFEEAQMNEWIKGSLGYCCQTLKAYELTRSGQRMPTTRPMPRRQRRCATTALPGRSVILPPLRWPTTCWSTCSRGR